MRGVVDGVTVAMWVVAAALPVIFDWASGRAAWWCRRWHLVVTVRGSAGSAESRLTAGLLRCPCCGGRLARWGHARRRLVAMGSGWEEF